RGPGAGDNAPCERAALPVEGAQQAPSRAAEQLAAEREPAADELPAGERAKPLHELDAPAARGRGFGQRRVAGARRVARQAGEVYGLANRDHRDQVSTRLRDRVAHQPVDLVGGIAEEDQADLTTAQQTVNGDRIEVGGGGFLAA